MNPFWIAAVALMPSDGIIDFVAVLRVVATCRNILLPEWASMVREMQRASGNPAVPGGLGAQLRAVWQATVAPLLLLATHGPTHWPGENLREGRIIQLRVRHVHAWRPRPMRSVAAADAQLKWRRSEMLSELVMEGYGQRRGRGVQFREVQHTLRFRLYLWEIEVQETALGPTEEDEWSCSDSSEEA